MKYVWKLCVLAVITATFIVSTESRSRRDRRAKSRARRGQQNCYDKLGVATDATDRQIKKAFRKLAMKYHPDKVQEEDKAQAEDKFKELAHCYELLSNADQRSQYDASGYNEQFASQGGRPGGFQFQGSFEDIFGSFFGKGNRFGFENVFGNKGSGGGFEHMFGGGGPGAQFGFGGGSPGGGSGSRSGSRSHAHNMGNMYGGHHEHSPRKSKPGPKTKRVYVDLEDLMDDSFQSISTKRMGNVEVMIPKGCPEGHRIKENGMEFEIRSKPHEDYKRGERSHKSDLYTNVSITLEQALLGFNLEIMTIDGELMEEYIESVPPSLEYQIKRKGLMRFGESATTRGHLYIHFDIQIPTLNEDRRDKLKEHLSEYGDGWDYSEAKQYRKKQKQRQEKRNKRKNKRKTEL